MNQDNNFGRVVPEPLMPVVPESSDNDRFFGEEISGQAENVINPEVPTAVENQVVAPIVEAQNLVSEPVIAVPASPAEAVSSETVSKMPDQPAICDDPKKVQAANLIFNKEPVYLGGLYEISDGLYPKE